MEMFLQILLLVLGFVMLVKGADWFVDGAASIASKFGIPQLEDEQIVGAKKIVDSLTVDEDCYQLFDSVFGYLIKNHSFKRRLLQKNQNDILDTQTQMTL